jgi:hypothetical protein
MRFKLKPLILLFILPFFISCVDNADFDQINLDLDPIVNTPLVYFELDQLDFLEDTGAEIITVSDITDIDVFQTSTIRDNLERFDLVINIRKDFPRGFRISVTLLDDNLTPMYEFGDILFSSTLDEVDFRENVDIIANPSVLNSTKMLVELELLGISGTPISSDVDWEIEFRSVGVFYLSF